MTLLSPHKKPKEPLWKISSKIYTGPEETLIKSRKKNTQVSEICRHILQWLRDYMRTVGWIFVSGTLFLLGFIVFSTPVFSLKSDRIELVLSPEPVFDREGIMSLLRDFTGHNILTLSTNEIFRSLSANIRHIQSVEKTLIFNDGMRITVTSFPPAYRAHIGDESFLLTENGQLITDIPEAEVPTLTVHHLTQDESLGKITPIMDDDMRKIRIIQNLWKKYLPTMNIQAIDLYDKEKEFHITSGGTRYIFTLINENTTIITTLAQLIDQKQLATNRYLYVDLRIPERLYICPLGENTCIGNLSLLYGNS